MSRIAIFAVLIIAILCTGCMQMQTRVNPGQTPEVYRANRWWIASKYPQRCVEPGTGEPADYVLYPCWQDPATKTIYVRTGMPAEKERAVVAKYYGVTLP
jgi:hypothetical protein